MLTMAEIRWEVSAIRDMKVLRASARPRIVNEVKEQLAHEPEKPSRRRKVIDGLKPPWSVEIGSFWQLSVVPYRVFYTVEKGVVTVRAIRRKPPGVTTEEIL